MISVKEAAALLNNISERRVRTLCAEGRIKGAKKISGVWLLPDKPQVTAAARVRAGKIDVVETKTKGGK